jgi:hypothetical protein
MAASLAESNIMRRRDFILAAFAITVCKPAFASAAETVQLLLIRDADEPIECSGVRFIRGNLFGVPSTLSLENAVSPIGLYHLSRTEELSYELNAPNFSSVPAGTYEAKIRNDRTKTWMTSDNRAWRLELLNTPKRTAIQFHFGKDYHWSAGCIILAGDSGGNPLCQKGSDSPEEAVAKLRDYVTTGHDSKTKIMVKIIFAGA